MMKWNYAHYLMFNPKTGMKLVQTPFWIVEIDPRGHFTMLRCAAIKVFDSILERLPKLEKPLVEFCMFLSCYPTF